MVVRIRAEHNEKVIAGNQPQDDLRLFLTDLIGDIADLSRIGIPDGRTPPGHPELEFCPDGRGAVIVDMINLRIGEVPMDIRNTVHTRFQVLQYVSRFEN